MTEHSCKVVEQVRSDLLARSRFGIQKYGRTIAENPSDRRGRLQHLYEELLDAANYACWEIMQLDAEISGQSDLFAEAVPISPAVASASANEVSMTAWRKIGPDVWFKDGVKIERREDLFFGKMRYHVTVNGLATVYATLEDAKDYAERFVS